MHNNLALLLNNTTKVVLSFYQLYLQTSIEQTAASHHRIEINQKSYSLSAPWRNGDKFSRESDFWLISILWSHAPQDACKLKISLQDV